MNRWPHVTVRISLAFALYAGVVTSALAQQFDSGTATIRFVKNPEPIPEFTVKTLDGKSIGPGEWQGKVVLVDFWATWCPPCLDELSILIRLQSKYADRLQVVGLSLDGGPQETLTAHLKSFVQQRGINYPVAIASSELQAKFGGILALPTAFLLDERSRVVQKHVGVVNPRLYETEIRALLGLSVDAKIERFGDTGQVFLGNAKRAQQLPGVDLSELPAERKEAVLRVLNERMCPCGCRLTLAQCRINDSTCPVSLRQTAEVVEKTAMEAQSQQLSPKH